MRDEDRLYYEQRAEREIALSHAARDEAVARAHALLAGYYLDLIHNRSGGPAERRERIEA
jgi:hypothetical protein